MLNLNELQPKIKLILLIGIPVLITVIVLAILALNPGKQKAKEQPTAQPSLTPEKVIPPKSVTQQQPQRVKDIKQEIISKPIRNQGGDLILKESSALTISYVPKLEIFFVAIKAEPVDNLREEAHQWFLNFGLKNEDLCQLPVRFLLYNPTLKKAHSDFKILPNGCS